MNLIYAQITDGNFHRNNFNRETLPFIANFFVFIKDIIKKVLKDNPNEVKRFQDGEDKLLSYFMGKVMKESKGKINHEIIIQELNNSLKKS